MFCFSVSARRKSLPSLVDDRPAKVLQRHRASCVALTFALVCRGETERCVRRFVVNDFASGLLMCVLAQLQAKSSSGSSTAHGLRHRTELSRADAVTNNAGPPPDLP